MVHCRVRQRTKECGVLGTSGAGRFTPVNPARIKPPEGLNRCLRFTAVNWMDQRKGHSQPTVWHCVSGGLSGVIGHNSPRKGRALIAEKSNEKRRRWNVHIVIPKVPAAQSNRNSYNTKGHLTFSQSPGTMGIFPHTVQHFPGHGQFNRKSPRKPALARPPRGPVRQG